MQITHKYAKWKYIYIIYIPSIQSEGTTLKLFIYFISLKPFLFKLCFILTLAFIAQPLLCLSSNIIKFFINILEKWKISNEEKNNWQRIQLWNSSTLPFLALYDYPLTHLHHCHHQTEIFTTQNLCLCFIKIYNYNISWKWKENSHMNISRIKKFSKIKLVYFVPFHSLE